MALLQLERSRLQNALDLCWRDPELRFASDFGDETEYEPGNGTRHQDIVEYGASLRFYISNPFVNRWVKKQASLNAASILSVRDELAYAVRSETLVKCYEAAVLEDQRLYAETTLALKKKICARYRELEKEGFAYPLRILKAELDLAEEEQEADRLRREHRNALYQISLLTGLDIENIRLEPIDSQTLPDPQSLDVDSLTETALRMRPDLQSIRCEIDLARNEVEIAKARQIPWFDFVEGGVRDRNADSTSYSASGVRHSDSDRDEWLFRTALSLPFFSWKGHETALARALLNEARSKEALVMTTIRGEIRNARDNYADSFDTRTRMREKTADYLSQFKQALQEIDNSKAVIETDIMNTEEQLTSYQQGVRRYFYECVKLRIYLESLTGDCVK